MDRQIIEIIADTCDMNPDDIELEGLLVEYGVDSARAVDLVVALEDAFQFKVSDGAATRLRTVADVIRFVEEGRAT